MNAAELYELCATGGIVTGVVTEGNFRQVGIDKGLWVCCECDRTVYRKDRPRHACLAPAPAPPGIKPPAPHNTKPSIWDYTDEAYMLVHQNKQPAGVEDYTDILTFCRDKHWEEMGGNGTLFIS